MIKVIEGIRQTVDYVRDSGSESAVSDTILSQFQHPKVVFSQG